MTQPSTSSGQRQRTFTTEEVLRRLRLASQNDPDSDEEHPLADDVDRELEGWLFDSDDDSATVTPDRQSGSSGRVGSEQLSVQAISAGDSDSSGGASTMTVEERETVVRGSARAVSRGQRGRGRMVFT